MPWGREVSMREAVPRFPFEPRAQEIYRFPGPVQITAMPSTGLPDLREGRAGLELAEVPRRERDLVREVLGVREAPLPRPDRRYAGAGCDRQRGPWLVRAGVPIRQDGRRFADAAPEGVPPDRNRPRA
eukprot:8081164-Pyramimonas_sp.AAC.2